MTKSKTAKTLVKPQMTKNFLKSEHSFRWIAIGLFLLAFLSYANTLAHGFVLDDPLAITLNKNVTSGFSGILDIFFGSYREANFGGQLYRPLPLIQFAIEWQLMPDNPLIHHFFNVLWYALTVVLVYVVMRKWLPSISILVPLTFATIFALHPIHTEVVANIKSRDEIMSLFFLLSAFTVWDVYILQNKKSFLWLSVMLYFLSLLSKETAITMFPVFGLLCWTVYRQNLNTSMRKGLIFIIPVAIIFIIRFALFHGHPSPPVDIMDNPIVSADGFVQHLATSILILWKYLWILIIPYPLSSDYSYLVIPLTGLSDVRVWVGILIYGLMILFSLAKLKQKEFLGLSLVSYLLAISLFSQLLMTIGTMFGERLAYLGSFWLLGGLVYLIYTSLTLLKSSIKTDQLLVWLFSPVAVIFVFLTVNRNTVWKNNYTLFTTDAHTYPTSVRLNNGAAEESVRLSDQEHDPIKRNELLTRAEEYCNQIMIVKPVATAYLTLGNIRMRQQKYKEAVEYYEQVNDLKQFVDRNLALAYRELGRQAGEKEKDIPKAQQNLSLSIKLNPNDAETWFILGVSYGVTGNHSKAAEHFEKAYQLSPSVNYAKNAMNAYLNAGNTSKYEQFKTIVERK